MPKIKLAKLERMAEKALNKMVGGKIAKMPLEQQVKLTRKLMGMPGGGMVNVRARLLNKNGLPADILDMVKEGKSWGDIKEFYWSCEAFRKLWYDLEMTEVTLDTLIDETLEGIDKSMS